MVGVVDPEERLALLHLRVVLHEHLRDGASHARRERHDVRVHERVVRLHVAAGEDQVHAEGHERERRDDPGTREDAPPAAAARSGLGGGGLLGNGVELRIGGDMSHLHLDVRPLGRRTSLHLEEPEKREDAEEKEPRQHQHPLERDHHRLVRHDAVHRAQRGLPRRGRLLRRERTQLIIDVVPKRGGQFSLEGAEGVRFLTRSRLFSAEELSALTA
jgi:hypothetical protein